MQQFPLSLQGKKHVGGFLIRYVGDIQFFSYVLQFYQLDSHKESCVAPTNLQ